MNPYRPGAGRRPPLLAGREPLLDTFDVVCRRIEAFGEGDRSWVLNGLRGVGKTALLAVLLDRVSTSGWITATVEAGSTDSLAVSLSQALVRSLRTATGRHPQPRLRRLLGVFKAFSVKVDPSGSVSLGIEIDAIHGVADSGRLGPDLASLLEVLGETARDLGVGVLLLVDELQEATAAELAAVNTAVHRIGQSTPQLPVIFVGAGLPSLPAQLAEATSYAERLYDYRPVGLLDPDAARDALVVPADRLDVAWEPDGLAAALAAAGGYPYFLQSIGKHVWDLAIGAPITAADVTVGLVAARREVDDGLYRSRWERATPAQRQLLRALAAAGAGAPAAISDVATAMGESRRGTPRKTSDLSVAREELIKKGLLYSPERGLLAFTVPGMDDFITRQPDP